MASNYKKIFNQNGFTLIEVLIAITILSFIMLAIVSTTDSSQQVKDRVLSEDRETLQVETAFSRFEWDFSQIYSPLFFSHEMKQTNLTTEDQINTFQEFMANYTNNNRFPKPSYDGIPIPKFTVDGKNDFTFFTLSNRRKFQNIKQSHFAWVKYTLENSDEEEPRAKGILVRKFLSNDVFDSEDIKWDDVKTQVLLRNVESLTFEFWDKDKKKWVDNIQLITNGSHLLYGVKITLEWIAKDNSKRTFFRIYRSLFPYFTPEDMYALQKGTTPTTTTKKTEEESENEN